MRALSNKVVVGPQRRRKSGGEGGGERLRAGGEEENWQFCGGKVGERTRLKGRSLRKGWHLLPPPGPLSHPHSLPPGRGETAGPALVGDGGSLTQPVSR